MIIFLYSLFSTKEFDEPAHVYYAGIFELLVLDAPLAALLYGAVFSMRAI